MSTRLLVFSALWLAACDPKGSDKEGADTDDTDALSDTGTEAASCDLALPVPCEDDLYLDLSLQDDASAGPSVTDTLDGDDHLLAIDATAGGTQGVTTNPWVYVRFEQDGAVQVDLTDAEALASGDWDLAAKRFQLRLNGGSSGPSCVSAQAFPTAAYADVTLPAGEFQGEVDAFYDKSCTFVADGSGLPDSPQLALTGWWTYPGCVATTETPFIVRRADGTHLKLVVEAYYASGQDTCNTTGAMGTGSANLQLRWAFLP